MPQTWRFDLGATTHPGQIASFRAWAPLAQQVSLRLGRDLSREVALTRTPGGFHESVVMSVQFGTRYAYVVDGGAAHPDPASRGQAEGPLGPSLVVETLPDRWLDPAHLLYAQALRASTVHLGWLGEYHVGLLELRVDGAWPGLPELVGEVTQRAMALGLAERPVRLVAPAFAPSHGAAEGGAHHADQGATP